MTVARTGPTVSWVCDRGGYYYARLDWTDWCSDGSAVRRRVFYESFAQDLGSAMCLLSQAIDSLLEGLHDEVEAHPDPNQAMPRPG
jgi:hypothetical protein